MSSFMLGDAESSGRESFLYFGTDGEIVAVKWRSMKIHFRYTDFPSWIAPYVKPQAPMVCDLVSDPHETIDLMQADLTIGWVIAAALRPLLAYEQSLAQYPNIAMGEEDFIGYE
jgi:arylsulfatase